MNILVVDDSESIRELVAMTLETAGYTVFKSPDGQDALLQLQTLELNLVITDLNMPHLDGIGLLREIRKDTTKAGLPVLLLTTESQLTKKDEAKAAGATGWIVKPFAQDKLLSVVQKVIR
jgi:two-component system, chemotaxis family, chemotaxis protein CheY